MVDAARITHAEIVRAAERWLKKVQRCAIVLADVNTWATREQPDCVGWTTAGFSTVVECKASRSDFLRDAKKPHRRAPERGMGAARFYMAPAGVVRALSELPPGWGHLVVERGATGILGVAGGPRGFPGQQHRRNDQAEKALLVAALRRATEGWGRTIFGEDAPAGMVDGDAHRKPARVIRELRADVARLRLAAKGGG